MRNQRTSALVKTSLVLVALVVGGCAAQMATASKGGPPFGDKASVAYSQRLWAVLEDARLVGEDTIRTKPYVGQEPHGAILENVDTTVTVDGHTGVVYVKKNYVADNLTVEQVAEEFDKYLASVTVMFRRERGYDAADKDWYWAKYKPDGSLHTNPKGMKLAGRVAKGAPKGCIACHKAAPGGDFVWTNNRHAGY